MKTNKIIELKKLIGKQEPTINLTVWSDADLRILAIIQDKTEGKASLLTDTDKKSLSKLSAKYLHPKIE